MTLTANIPASRTGFGFPVTVVAPMDAPDTLAPMVRSFLRHVDSVSLSHEIGEIDGYEIPAQLSKWVFTVDTLDGWKRDYRFNGVEIVRSGAYRPATVAEIVETMRMFTRDESVEIPQEDEVNPLDAPQVATTNSRFVTDRAAINRRDNARRVLAKAMGYTGNKDWSAAGFPLDLDVATASDNPAGIKPHKFEGKVKDAEIPTGSGIPAYSVSVVRPHKLNTGMHSAIGSHNK